MPHEGDFDNVCNTGFFDTSLMKIRFLNVWGCFNHRENVLVVIQKLEKN